MTLYDSIVQHQKDIINLRKREIAEIEGTRTISWCMDVLYRTLKNKIELMQMEKIFRYAFDNQHATYLNKYKADELLLDVETLDRVIRVDMSQQEFDLFRNQKVRDARKKWLKKESEFYQALFRQAKDIESYEELVKELFETEREYKRAIEPIYDARLDFYRRCKDELERQPDLISHYSENCVSRMINSLRRKLGLRHPYQETHIRNFILDSINYEEALPNVMERDIRNIYSS